MLGSNATISTYRLTESGTKKEFSGSATLTGLDVYLEKAQPEVTAFMDEQSALNTFKMWTDDIFDIVIGDKVVDQDSNNYIVKGVQKYSNNVDVENHMEIIITQKYT